MTAFHCNSSAEDTIRKAAVAGQFYPGDAKSLKSAVEKYLKQVDSSKLGQTPQLLISPHAGFSFSGPVAANGYAALANDIKTVILIGPSHYMRFEGVSIPEVSAYETPLGKVDVNQEMVAKLRKNPVVKSQPGAHAAEHCLEVQLPFLQVKLQHFQIVPILTGRCNPAEIASFVLPLIDEHTVVVASSDLSHYLPQDKAREVDDATIKMIMSGNFSIEGIEGCGAMPIMIIMQIAEKMELKPVLLDTRTSYETAPELGSPSRVVGYTSIGYIKKTPDSTMKDSVTPDPSATAEEHEKGDSTDVESSKGEGNEDISEPDSTSEEQQESSSGLNREIRMYLLTLARESLTAAVKKMAMPFPDHVPGCLQNNSGCFVTLTKNNNLRGCIGYIEPIKPLYKAVIENARNAALDDPRFPAVTPDELDSIRIEISVLSVPQPLQYDNPQELLEKLVPGKDGVILQKGPYQSTYLPQVWEQLPEKESFLTHLALKGGMGADGWKRAQIKTYQATHFEENQ